MPPANFNFSGPVSSGDHTTKLQNKNPKVDLSNLPDNMNPFDRYLLERRSYYDGLSDERRKVLDSNPYLSFDYKDSLWDTIGSGFGFRTGRDAAFEEQLMLARKWDSDYLGVFREEDYNNPVEGSQRMRSSGQNPDLLGVSPQTAGQASEFTESEGVPSRSDTTTAASDFMNGVAGVITTVLGAASQVQEIESISLANSGKKIENNILQTFGDENASVDFYQKLLNSAVDHVANFMSEDDFNQVQYDVEHGIKPSYVVSQEMTGFSRKTNRRYNQIISSLFKGIKSREDFMNKYGSYLEKRTDVAVKKGSKYYSDDDDSLRKVVSELSSLNDDILKLSLQYSKKQFGVATKNLNLQDKSIDYETSVINARSEAEIPQKSAAAEAASLDSEAALKEFREQLQKVVNQHISRLTSNAQEPGLLGVLSSIASTYLYLLSNDMISMPSFSSSSRVDTIDPNGHFTTTSNNSFGF